jgi:hypothetical protein
MACTLWLAASFCGVLPWMDLQQVAVELKTTASGEAVRADLLEIQEQELLVRIDGQEQTVAIDNVQSIRFPDSPAASSPTKDLEVRFLDGSIAFPRKVTTEGQQTLLEFDADFRMEIPTADMASIRLQALSAAQQPQWEAILDSRIAGDTLALIRSAESMDSAEGLIGGIGEETIQFDFGGQQIEAPRKRLAGLRFFNPPKEQAKSICELSDVWGSRWNISSVRYDVESGLMRLNLVGGSMISLPPSRVQTMDFSIGSVHYLADKVPLDRGRQSALGLDIAVEGIDSVFGAQPTQVPKTAGPSLKFVGGGWATFRVPAEYSRLMGTVYLAPSGNRFTACRVQVKMENEVLWEQELTQLNQRLDLSVAIEADQRIRFDVIPRNDFPVGDVVIWQELRFLK